MYKFAHQLYITTTVTKGNMSQDSDGNENVFLAKEPMIFKGQVLVIPWRSQYYFQ